MGIATSNAGTLSAEEQKLVKDTWGPVMKDAPSIGSLIFSRFLETYNYHPYFKKFSGIPNPDLPQTKIFKEHVASIMSTVNIIISNAGDTEQLKSRLVSLGKMHSGRHLTQQQFLELKLIFLETINTKCNVSSKDIKVWDKAFDICLSFLFQGLEKEEST